MRHAAPPPLSNACVAGDDAISVHPSVHDGSIQLSASEIRSCTLVPSFTLNTALVEATLNFKYLGVGVVGDAAT